MEVYCKTTWFHLKVAGTCFAVVLRSTVMWFCKDSNFFVIAEVGWVTGRPNVGYLPVEL